MIEFFLKRRMLTNLITVFICVVGGWYSFSVRREAFPDIRFDLMTINTVFPGASPEEVETLVTRKVEDELRGIAGLKRVESYSLESRSLSVIQLDDGLSERDSGRVINEVYQAINRVKDLPAAVDRPVAMELTSARPLITLSVAGADDEVRDRFSEELKDILEEVPGVARVEASGQRAREIWVEADPALLRQHGVTIGELAQAVRARNVDLSAGSVEVGTRELYVRVAAKARTASEIARFVVRANDDRSVLRVSDVAGVRETFEEARVLTRAGGKPSIELKVSKLKSGDAISMVAAVRAAVKEVAAHAREQGLELTFSDDFTFFIKRRLRVMTSNMLQGGFLVLGALFLFLDWRLAVVAAWGVPISFAAAMMVAVPLGFTINLLSLLGFIIVLGMLDDDSVVVAENIYRHLEMGKSPERAAIDGAREVVLPVVGSVLVSSCAFLPFALMSGIMGKFLFMIPVIVCMSFLASLFEAFFILPSHVVDLLPFGKPVGEKADPRWIVRTRDAYERTLRWTLTHRWRFLAVVVTVGAATALLAWARVKFVMFPPGLIDQVFIQVDMPRGTSLTETAKALAEVEAEVLKLPSSELEALTSAVGLKGAEESVRLGTHFAQARLFLTPEESRSRKTVNILKALRPKMDAIKGPEKIVFDEVHPGPPGGKAVQVRVRGRDWAVIKTIAAEVHGALGGMPGIHDIQDSREGGKDQLRLAVDEGEARFAGLDYSQLAQSLFYAVDGGKVSKVQRDEKDLDVKVRLTAGARGDVAALLGLDVTNPQGRQIRLGRVARFEERQGPPFLSRYNFRPVITVTAEVDGEKITSRQANAQLKKRFADIGGRYPGYQLIYGGEEERTQESMGSLFRSFGVVLLLDFVILAALFRSYIQPLIILTSVPIGLMGVVWALIMHGAPASFMALLGVVAMTGVVINNAIVLIDLVNTKREEGLPPAEACVQAGVQRLRPIAAASITTLLGLFPSAYGFGGYEPFVAPMTLTLAWGLTFAMPLTLFLVPSIYVMVEDARSWLGRKRTKNPRIEGGHDDSDTSHNPRRVDGGAPAGSAGSEKKHERLQEASGFGAAQEAHPAPVRSDPAGGDRAALR